MFYNICYVIKTTICIYITVWLKYNFRTVILQDYVNIPWIMQMVEAEIIEVICTRMMQILSIYIYNIYV